MTLAVMALYADGTTTLRNIASWRVKETDRIAAMAVECRKLGATVEEGTDFIRITPPENTAAWKRASIHTYDDHRVAMCFSLAAFNPAGLPVRIIDPKCVGKTFPDYFEALFSVCQTNPAQIPVICIDGPTASGKGTLSAEVARSLGYHLLDSGALYRLVGLAAERAGLSTAEADLTSPTHASRLGTLAAGLRVRFAGDRILLNDEDVSEALRTEAAGMAASRVSAVPEIRAALLSLQHGFRRLPGLVADGRDMGTVLFPDASLKLFLTASAQQRAQRRHKQLISKGIDANIEDLLVDLKARDERDTNRPHAPLKPDKEALMLDNSSLSVEQSVQQVLSWWQGEMAFPAASSH
jgi:3-phosphoshikimate 1-carboxyvinyltransferase